MIEVSSKVATSSASAFKLMPLIMKIFGGAAPISSLALYLAPISTIMQIKTEQSVGGRSLLPYTSMLVNNIVWFSYGLLKKESIIIFASGPGLILSAIYFLQFIRLAPPQSPNLPGKVNQHIQFVCCVLLASTCALLLSIVAKSIDPTNLFGKAGMIFTMTMFASPLAAIRSVIQTQSASIIPMPVTIASLVNNYLWGAVGFIDMKDVNVYLPAAVGLSFSFMQLGLKLWFRENRVRAEMLTIKPRNPVHA
jgi:solute carrier family 50 (sugar transporter)